MLLRHRTTPIGTRPITQTQGFEHIDQSALALLRWLNDNRVEFVLVGAVAEALRGHTEAVGPLAIVPAPYHRNLTRLASALNDTGAAVRMDGVGPGGKADTTETKLSSEKLARGQRWRLRCGSHDIDIEPLCDAAEQSDGLPPSYQELLYEAARFEPSPGLVVEVASPEDIEHYTHLRTTGRVPEIRISRQARVGQDAG